MELSSFGTRLHPHSEPRRIVERQLEMKSPEHQKVDENKFMKIKSIALTAGFKLYLRDQTVEVCVCGSLNVKRASTDVINGFIVKKYRNVCMFKERVG